MVSPFAGRRILVVEDELLVSWVVQDLLTELGCVVLGPSANVRQAMAIIAREPVDAAVLDVNLDGQMSYPVADELAARGVPFVLSTGYDTDRIPANYKAVPVLQKPLSSRELRDRLAIMLGRREPERASPTGDTPSAPDA